MNSIKEDNETDDHNTIEDEIVEKQANHSRLLPLILNENNPVEANNETNGFKNSAKLVHYKHRQYNNVSANKDWIDTNLKNII